MALPPDSQNSARAARCIPWGFWATTAWALFILVAWMMTEALVVIALFHTFGPSGSATVGELQRYSEQAWVIASAVMISAALAIATIVNAVRMRGCDVREYLALVRPARNEVVLGVLCIAILLPLGDLASYLAGRDIVPPFVVEAYKSAREAGTVVLFAIAICVAAPLMEELLFRGFVLPAYAGSRVGPSGAIVITSALWALLHVQYDLFFLIQVFVIGCVFGWLRWRSGSTLLVLWLHAFVNAAALLQTAFIVEFLR